MQLSYICLLKVKDQLLEPADYLPVLQNGPRERLGNLLKLFKEAQFRIVGVVFLGLSEALQPVVVLLSFFSQLEDQLDRSLHRLRPASRHRAQSLPLRQLESVAELPHCLNVPERVTVDSLLLVVHPHGSLDLKKPGTNNHCHQLLRMLLLGWSLEEQDIIYEFVDSFN